MSVTTRPAFSFGDATPIPRPFGPGAPSVRALYDVMPDGRFVGMRPIGDLRPVYQAGEIHIVLNWFEELNARVQPSP